MLTYDQNKLVVDLLKAQTKAEVRNLLEAFEKYVLSSSGKQQVLADSLGKVMDEFRHRRLQLPMVKEQQSLTFMQILDMIDEFKKKAEEKSSG